MPPLECWLGVMPRDALKSLPDLKTLGSGLKATIADAISGPKAGISSSNRIVWFLPLARASGFSRSPIFSSRPSLCEASIAVACLASSGRVSSACASASNSLTRWDALGRDQAELREMPAQRVDGHGSLLDQQFPGLAQNDTACSSALS